MKSIWLIAILLFLGNLFLFYKLTIAYYKRESGENMYKLWGSKLYFWQGAIYVSTGLTLLMLYILYPLNVLAF